MGSSWWSASSNGAEREAKGTQKTTGY